MQNHYSNWIFAFLELYEISCQILFSKMHLLFQCLESVYLWNNGVCTGSLFWRKRKHCVKDNSRFWGRKMRKSASKVEKPKRTSYKMFIINRYNLIILYLRDSIQVWYFIIWRIWGQAIYTTNMLILKMGISLQQISPKNTNTLVT